MKDTHSIDSFIFSFQILHNSVIWRPYFVHDKAFNNGNHGKQAGRLVLIGLGRSAVVHRGVGSLERVHEGRDAELDEHLLELVHRDEAVAVRVVVVEEQLQRRLVHVVCETYTMFNEFERVRK